MAEAKEQNDGKLVTPKPGKLALFSSEVGGNWESKMGKFQTGGLDDDERNAPCVSCSRFFLRLTQTV